MNVRALPATWSLPRVRVGVDALAWAGLVVGILYVVSTQPGGDARVFYTVPFPPNYAESGVGTFTFSYAPAAALVLQPFHLLPWTAFYGLVVTLDVMALAWLLGPWITLLVIVVQVPFLFDSLAFGSLNCAMAALLVLGVTRPAPWVALALTKVTPGIGIAWHALRGEWRMVGWFTLATLALLLVPGSLDWITYLLSQSGGGLLRYAVGGAVIAWGAWTGRYWAVPLAVGIVGHPAAGHWAALAALPKVYATLRK